MSRQPRDIEPSPDGGRMSDEMIDKLASGQEPDTGALAYLRVMAREIKRTRALVEDRGARIDDLERALDAFGDYSRHGAAIKRHLNRQVV